MIFNDSIPNCVPEYYREMFSKADHEYELMLEKRERMEEYFEADKKILYDAEDNGLSVLCAFSCDDHCDTCKDRSRELMTNEQDDMCRFVCYRRTCKYRKDR